MIHSVTYSGQATKFCKVSVQNFVKKNLKPKEFEETGKKVKIESTIGSSLESFTSVKLRVEEADQKFEKDSQI